MGLMYIRRDLNIEHLQIDWKTLPQEGRYYVHRNKVLIEAKVDAETDVNQVLILKRRPVSAMPFSGN
jgi:hypothetical protein